MDKYYNVSFKSMDPSASATYGRPWQKGDVEIYSDGSKDTDGMAGGMCSIYKGK